jgi:hypothetical protein
MYMYIQSVGGGDGNNNYYRVINYIQTHNRSVKYTCMHACMHACDYDDYTRPAEETKREKGYSVHVCCEGVLVGVRMCVL